MCFLFWCVLFVVVVEHFSLFIYIIVELGEIYHPILQGLLISRIGCEPCKSVTPKCVVLLLELFCLSKVDILLQWIPFKNKSQNDTSLFATYTKVDAVHKKRTKVSKIHARGYSNLPLLLICLAS